MEKIRRKESCNFGTLQMLLCNWRQAAVPKMVYLAASADARACPTLGGSENPYEASGEVRTGLGTGMGCD